MTDITGLVCFLHLKMTLKFFTKMLYKGFDGSDLFLLICIYHLTL